MARIFAFLIVAALAGIACRSDHPSSPSSTGDEPADGKSLASAKLLWPIDCVPGKTCDALGHADVDKDNVAFDCSTPFIQGHEGTDIPITREQMQAGVAVYAAADGDVLWVFDGRFDDCPNANEPECAEPAQSPKPGESQGTVVCTELGPYCRDGKGQCYWCFAGGNVVVIRHHDMPGVFATRYDHFRKNSILVKPGDHVRAGDRLGLVGSAGHSTRPHLHFEVWGETYYAPAEPFAGKCGTNKGASLWAHDPAWAGRE